MINCVVAIEKNQGIGYSESMPWPRLPDDMRWFKGLTQGHVVVMGSVTYRGLGKPLPNRKNVVITSSDIADIHCCRSPTEAIALCQGNWPDLEIFIIGGQTLYDSTMSIIDRFYVTEIDHSYQCDRFFNLKYVRDNFMRVIERGQFTDPVPYTIREYSKCPILNKNI